MRRAVVNWAGGMTLIWVLAMTLWLPWLDSGKSYRTMVFSLMQSLPEKYNCIARNASLGDSQRAMLYYFGGLITRRDPARSCELRLIQGDKASRPLLDESLYEKIWQGSRKTDKNEQYRLYKAVNFDSVMSDGKK
jgi:hypothetical protein